MLLLNKFVMEVLYDGWSLYWTSSDVCVHICCSDRSVLPLLLTCKLCVIRLSFLLINRVSWLAVTVYSGGVFVHVVFLCVF